ncbi:hypothetical protein QBC38DRAFT_188800 [Podospora fimiseda]|uniref:Uncharacterized protein n=1 Tax=Podospora fimiseda TaxID=252190 RepID=A0AAN7BG98_9PEZI|nr:hypothetical protein QBC38DRAFT_188800 [Podospora fimiseda]
MADAAAAAAGGKVCPQCRIEKEIDQFRSIRGPPRIVHICLDCRRRDKEQRGASNVRVSAAATIARGDTPNPPPAPPPRQNLTHRILAERYHEGGRVTTDTPEMAAARNVISATQRRHRIKRRHGGEPSQTPTMSSLLRREQPSEATSTLPPSAQPGYPQKPAADLPPSAQPRESQEGASQDEETDDFGYNQGPVAPSRLPRRGRPPLRRPPSSPSSPARGRPRGRPRLARNPVGRPRTRPPPEERTNREFDEPPPRFTGAD